jgi:hypothetical protein
MQETRMKVRALLVPGLAHPEILQEVTCSSKNQFSFDRFYNTTSQKLELIVATAVGNSHPTFLLYFHHSKLTLLKAAIFPFLG